MKNERIDYIDYLKAVGIIIALLVHSDAFIILNNFGVSATINNIGNITMILFFICSGFTTSQKEKSLKEIFIYKFKKLIIPFWVANIIYAIYEICRAYYFGYGDYKIIFPSIYSLLYGTAFKTPYIPGFTELCAEAVAGFNEINPNLPLNIILPTNPHLWFLPALFTGYVMFTLYTYYVKKRGILDAIMVVIFLGLAYFESPPTCVQLPYCLGRGFFVSACMIVGLNLRHNNILEFNKKNLIIFIFAIIFIFTLFNQITKETEFIRSSYPRGDILGVYIYFIVGVSVSILLLFLFKIISIKFKSKLLSEIGKNTMTIYLWHMIFLTVFGVIVLRIFGVPVEMHEYHMTFIPYDKVGLTFLVVFLSLVACMLIVYIKTLSNQSRQ